MVNGTVTGSRVIATLCQVVDWGGGGEGEQAQDLEEQTKGEESEQQVSAEGEHRVSR